MIDTIYNEDCRETMQRMPANKCDVILTSPFYNTTTKKRRDGATLENTRTREGQYNYIRYDKFADNMTNDEYNEFTANLFRQFGKILKPDGVVLYNLNYGSANTVGMFLAINEVITKTEFTIADVIVWEKSNALPNSTSPNKLTRMYEFVFVCCRKDELKTFHSNKRCTQKRFAVNGSGQPIYENITNIIKAPNNNGPCPYNKATYSEELCEALLNIYCPTGGVVYDPFMGSGTTAAACKKMGLHWIGSEISANQVDWANKRLGRTTRKDEPSAGSAQLTISDWLKEENQ